MTATAMPTSATTTISTATRAVMRLPPPQDKSNVGDRPPAAPRTMTRCEAEVTGEPSQRLGKLKLLDHSLGHRVGQRSAEALAAQHADQATKLDICGQPGHRSPPPPHECLGGGRLVIATHRFERFVRDVGLDAFAAKFVRQRSARQTATAMPALDP